VNADVVHDNDVAALESWSQHLLDVRQEACTIHWPIQQQRRRDAIMPQRRDEGRSLPVAKWHFADKALAARSATVPARHIGGRTGFVDEYEASGIEPHLHSLPRLARRGDVRTVLFGRV
jgi:hypothetical protein